MKKSIVVLLSLVFCLTLAAAVVQAKSLEEIKQAGKIVIGVKGDYPPWGVINKDNEFEGWEIDLCHKLARVSAGAIPRPWNLWRLPAATVFHSSTPARSTSSGPPWAIPHQRAKVVDYSIPYFKSGVQLLAKKGYGYQVHSGPGRQDGHHHQGDDRLPGPGQAGAGCQTDQIRQDLRGLAGPA